MDRKTSDPGPQTLSDTLLHRDKKPDTDADTNRHTNTLTDTSANANTTGPRDALQDDKPQASLSLNEVQGAQAAQEAAQKAVVNIRAGLNNAMPSPKPTTKRKPPFDWQLLPQDELDRIAYNSRKQQKTRLRENPPTCPNCPKAHFTSLAMLATHLQSKKHLARAKKQSKEDQDQQDRAHGSVISTLSVSTRASVNIDVAISEVYLPAEAPAEAQVGVGSGSNGRIAASDRGGDVLVTSGSAVVNNKATSMSKDGSTTEQTSTGKPSKQRKRKAERDRKKARAQLARVTSPTTSAPLEDAASTNSLLETGGVGSELGIAKDVRTDGAGTQGRHRNDGPCPATGQKSIDDPGTTSSPQTATAHSVVGEASEGAADPEPSSRPASQRSGASTSASSTAAAAGATNAGESEGLGVQSQWHCSVCGSRWRKIKAWQGHLLSAQHLRRVLRVMQQIAPPPAPYGRKDVQASRDPFGWGTGTGVVEEEEDEDEDEEDKEADDISSTMTIAVPARTGEVEMEDVGDDECDMDLGE